LKIGRQRICNFAKWDGSRAIVAMYASADIARVLFYIFVVIFIVLLILGLVLLTLAGSAQMVGSEKGNKHRGTQKTEDQAKKRKWMRRHMKTL